eukprot:8178505-Pyramimonas_sp.AAC.1
MQSEGPTCMNRKDYGHLLLAFAVWIHSTTRPVQATAHLQGIHLGMGRPLPSTPSPSSRVALPW